MANTIQIPRRLPLLVVTDNVLLPGSSMRIPVRSLRNMNMIRSRLLGRNTLSSTVIGVVPQEPGQKQGGDEHNAIHPIGTAAVVIQVTGTNWPKPSYTLLVTGLCRFKVDDLLQETPYLVAKVTQLDKLSSGEEGDEELKRDTEQTTLAENFREQAAMLVDMLDISVPVVAKLKKMLESVPIQYLPDICTALVKASYTEKLEVLDAVNITERFSKTLPLLARQIEALRLLQKSKRTGGLMGGGGGGGLNRILNGNNKGTGSSGAGQRFGARKIGADGFDDDSEEMDEEDEMIEFERKIKAAGMSPEAHKAAMKELKRLKKMPQHMPEHATLRNYLELMVELPWSKFSTDHLDIETARKDLDVDHYGLDKLKKRVVEYLAVRQIKNSLKGPILCFVGPPGVGKTSVGRSIANTLGRQFHRISLGGVCDQSDIRGHRRTYIGSMPGRIMHGLKQVGVRNPVFLLDEIDKLSTNGIHGDPSAALLEVLDPEQNNSFVDHYLNVPFDLSQVLFIATANSLASIPPALLDRMEVIHVPGYVQEEKLHIAVRHLVPKQFMEHGLTAEHLRIPDESIKLLISSYTREAGVRSLERRIGAICRAVAVKVASHSPKQSLLESPDIKGSEGRQDEEAVGKERKRKVGVAGGGVKEEEDDVSETVDMVNPARIKLPPEMPIVIDQNAIEDILGPPMFESELRERLSQPGVAIGLAWTALGGEILYIEATAMSGEGKLTLTGQLGDVMKESANLALNWLRSNASHYGIATKGRDLLENTDVHIHFPAGAVSKDGPSAGVAVAIVLVSLFTGRCVRSDTAVTGEVTLRGLVLPVGGIKEKVLAAHRSGITRVILPKRNEKDLHEVPTNVQKDLTFIFARTLEDALDAAFDGGFPGIADKSPLIPSKL